MATGILELRKRLKGRLISDVAYELGVNDGHIYHARKTGDIAPTLHKAMIDAGWIRPEKKRHQTRLAATVTPEEKAVLLEWAAEHGLTWTKLCKMLVVGRKFTQEEQTMTTITRDELERRGWKIHQYPATGFVAAWLDGIGESGVIGEEHTGYFYAGFEKGELSDLHFSGGDVTVNLLHLTTIEQLEDLYRLLTGNEPPAGDTL